MTGLVQMHSFLPAPLGIGHLPMETWLVDFVFLLIYTYTVKALFQPSL